jgi:tetratricopeptide (TPR) repeat protein
MTGAQLAGGPSAALRELLARDGRRAPPVLAGLLAVVLFAWWAANEGGAAPGAWYPGALLCLVAHPLHGAGADNFAHDYARERRRGEEPLYPHSLVMRTFGQTGIVGAALLTGFLALVCLAVVRRDRERPREPVAVAALVCAVAWLAHASIDWLWELPALAAREIERAVRRFEADPAAALQGLERARRLNPLSDRADIIAGALALETGDRRRARRSFRRALARDRRNWYPEVQLGVLDLSEGRRHAALAHLGRARRMNPLEPAIAGALSAARRGVPATLDVERRLSLLTVQAPLGRRPVSCRPVLGLAAACVRRVGA